MLPNRSVPDVKEKREQWGGFAAEQERGKLVFLDESGINTDMTRRYGRAVGKTRVTDHVPCSTPKNTTIISSMRLDGTCAYDVINVRCNGEFTYPFFTEMMDILKSVKDHTFVVSNSCVDDTLYNIMLEYTYATGNRLVYARNDNEIWMAYEKFHKKNITYYIITFN